MIKISKNISILLFSLFIMVSCFSLKAMSSESNSIKYLRKEKEIDNIKYQIKKIKENINNITNECNSLISSNRNLNSSTLYISKEERNNKLNQNLKKLKQLRQQQIDNFNQIQHLKESLNSLENPTENNIRRSTIFFRKKSSDDLSDIEFPQPPKTPRNDSLKGIENLANALEETDDPAIIELILAKMDELSPPDEFEPEIEVDSSEKTKSEDEIDINKINIYDFEELKNYIEICQELNKQDINGNTLLHKIIMAIVQNFEESEQFIKFKKILNLLIPKNPNIKIKNNENQTAYNILNQKIKNLENLEQQDHIIKSHIDVLKQIEQLILNLLVNQYADNKEKLEKLLYRSIKRNYLLVFNSLFNDHFSNNMKIVLEAKKLALQYSRTNILNILENRNEILIKQQEEKKQEKIRKIQEQIKNFNYKFILNCTNINEQDELGNTINHYLMLAITTTTTTNINLKQTMFIVNQILPCLFEKNPIVKIKNEEGYTFHDILNNKINELENNTSLSVLLNTIEQSIILNLLIEEYSKNQSDIEKLEILLFNAEKRKYQTNIITQLKTKIEELRIDINEFYNNFTKPISDLNLANIRAYIENTESINAQDNSGDTLLHQIIKAIIENINNRDLFNKLRSLLKQFLGKNPNINIKNNNENSAYNILNEEIKKNDQYYQSYHSIENSLLNREVKQNKTNKEKLIKIFNIAIEHKHSGIVKKIGKIFLNDLPPPRKLFRNAKRNKIRNLFKNGLRTAKKIDNNTSVINILESLLEQI